MCRVEVIDDLGVCQTTGRTAQTGKGLRRLPDGHMIVFRLGRGIRQHDLVQRRVLGELEFRRWVLRREDYLWVQGRFLDQVRLRHSVTRRPKKRGALPGNLPP